MKNIKVLIIATLFIWALLIGSILTIGDRSVVSPYQEEPSTLQHFTNLVTNFK